MLVIAVRTFSCLSRHVLAHQTTIQQGYAPPSVGSVQSGTSPPLATGWSSQFGAFTAMKLILFAWLVTKFQALGHTIVLRISQPRRHMGCITDALNAGSHVMNNQRQMKCSRSSEHFLCTSRSSTVLIKLSAVSW